MTEQPEQPMVLPGLVVSAPPAADPVPAGSAERDPIAQVLVDVPLAHLDRPFDYAVPAKFAETAVPGARVKVRFAGQDVDGYVVARTAQSEHTGRLTPLRRVVSAEPVLTPEVAELTGRVAARWAGTRSDVLRLAVPPRHATVEKETSAPAPPAPPAAEPSGPLAGFARAVARRRAPRAVWAATPGEDWSARLAEVAAHTYSSGLGVLIVVPDVADVSRLESALTKQLGPDQVAVLNSEAGPAKRYRDFLAVRRGARRVVIGSRSASFAPVHGLGLVAIWDDGDDSHCEPRAPYPHAREVLLMRAERLGIAALVGGFARTVESAYLVESGWAQPLSGTREEVRAAVRVEVAGASEFAQSRDPGAHSARLPSDVLAGIREALSVGPVLVQTPRAGYLPSLACERCRHPARCRHCSGPLRLTGPTTPPDCRWCGRAEPAWACGNCQHRGLRAPTVGEQRTAHELGRTFPGVRVRTSSATTRLDRISAEPAIVVATPGAEPVAAGGYAAVCLMDAWLALSRADLRADEEALRRWFNAAGLVRPGGRVLIVGDPAHPVVQALVRWDPAGFALREMTERREAHLPPASRLATMTGTPAAVDEALAVLPETAGLEVLGPVPTEGVEDDVRLVLRVPRSHGAALSQSLGELQRTRSARKLTAVRIQVDPPALG